MTRRIALVLSFVFGCLSAVATVPIEGETVVCSGAWPISLRAPTGLPSYLWSTGETTSTIFITGPGTYTVTVMRMSGPDTGRITVREVPPPKPFIGNSPIYLCRGEFFTLKPTANFRTYQWSTGARTQDVLIDSAGFYTLTVTNADGCVGTSDSVQVIVVDRPQVSIYGKNTLCKDTRENYKTENIAGAIYTWNVVGGILEAGQGQPTARILWRGGNGTVELRVSVMRPDGGFCDTLVRYQVSVGTTLRPLLIFQRRQFCLGDSTVFDAGPGMLRYRWSTGDTTQTIVIKTPGRYWVDVAEATCSGASDTVTVIVYPPPDVRIAGDTSICDGAQKVLTAFALGNDVISWQWSTGHAQRSIFVDAPGVYSVVGRTVNGCVDSATITVQPAAQASVLAPDSLDLDSLELGSARFWPFRLQNRTTKPITVLSARLASLRANPRLNVPTLPNVIPGQSDLAFLVYWLGDVEGLMSDTLLLELDGPECPSTVRIPIRGYVYYRPRIPISISIGDTVVPVGTVLDMPIRIKATSPREEFVDLEFSVRWNNRVFHVTGLDAASVVSDVMIGADRTVRFRLPAVRFPIDTTLNLHGAVLLGSPLETDLVPDSVTVTASKTIYIVTTEPGHIAMTGCFLAGRLVSFSGPQPLTIITNMLGETLTCEVDALPSGAYLITTVSGTTVHTQRIVVVR